MTRWVHYIGRSHWNNSNNEFFEGSMDDMRVYNRAISLFEVEEIYKGDLEIETFLGGQNPKVYVYWGDEDAGQVTEVNASSDTLLDSRMDI